jgi:hypothetical protein
MIKYITILISVFAFTSCLDAERKAHLDKLDGMIHQLDSLKSNYAKIPLDSINLIREHVNNNERYIKNYYLDDTLDVDFARAMNRYRGIRKGSGYIVEKRIFLDTVFDFQLNQMKKLHTDISNGTGKRDKYEQFVKGEEENVNLILSSFKDFSERFSFMRKEFNEINPMIESIIERLKQGEEI